MKLLKAIATGVLVWILIASSFILLGNVPGFADSATRQGIAVIIAVPFYSWFAARILYRKNAQLHGLMVGAVSSVTALLLDVVITVPLIEIPKGSSYEKFFTDPLLWILIAENTLTIFLYWKIKVQSKYQAA